MTLTKAELADLLFEKVGLNKREAKDMVEAFFEEIRGALERGESVKLSGFGNFGQVPGGSFNSNASATFYGASGGVKVSFNP